MSSDYKPYPIQLADLTVVLLNSELIDKENEDYLAWLDKSKNGEPEEDSNSFCTLGVNHSGYDVDEKTVSVGLQAETFEKVEDGPLKVYHLTVRLVGIFTVDESNFPSTHVEDWAEKNAPLVLYPYVREHMYSLASRVGISGLILPLLQIPTFKVNK